MATKRRPRAKRAHAPVHRFRPTNLDEQFKDVRGYMVARAAEATTDEGRAAWTDTSRTNLVLIRDMCGPQIWPDDADVHAEHAEDVAVLDAYRSMLG